MFLAHFAVAMAAKKVAPKISLGTTFLAAQFLDLLWPMFLILGLERVRVVPGITEAQPFDFLQYPLSHSLIAAILWGIGLGILYNLRKRAKIDAIWIGFLVVTHWLLDAVAHRPDLPLLPTGPFVGLGLWNSVPWTLLVETTLFGIGIVIYSQCTLAKNKTGALAFWGLVLFLVIVFTNSIFGPVPPDDSKTIGLVAMSGWLLVAWGYWIDRHRTMKSEIT